MGWFDPPQRRGSGSAGGEIGRIPPRCGLFEHVDYTAALPGGARGRTLYSHSIVAGGLEETS